MTGASKRLLVLVPGDVGENMSGPAIRAWLLAQELSRDHDVTAAIEGALPERAPDGIRIVPATRRRLLAETVAHDAVMVRACPRMCSSRPAAAASSRSQITTTLLSWR